MSRVLVPGTSEISATYADGRSFSTYVTADLQLAARLQQKGVQIVVKPPPSDSSMIWLITFFTFWLPLLVCVWLWLSWHIRRTILGASEPP